jgi:hypothetical protein
MRQRPDRHRHRQPAAEYRVDRECRQHGAGDGPGVQVGTGFWGIGADITAPIFQGGTLLHQERAAKAPMSGGRTISQHGADRLPECRRHPDALEQDAEA